ncbi:MAG: beta-ketoacyl-[acyl-carrier-protein] synthase family protein [Pseudobacteriovorax sp.]|nr:beta-ketoacyl-[acyl-carrier-protein] synthase family protein [Pseudobacteriovorax sp.]
MNRRIVITGMGVFAPNGRGKEAFAEALKAGKSGITHRPEMADKKFGCQVGGVCSDIDEAAAEHFQESDLFAMSQGMKLGSVAALEAFAEAGLEIPPESGETAYVHEDTGAMIGTGIGGLDVFADKVYPNVEAKTIRRMGSTVVEQIMCSGTSAKIAGILGLGNQVSANSSACSTGTEAIISGYERIKLGLADRMLVGGVEAAHPHIWAGFDSMRVLSRKFNDDPERASRPMSQSAGGFVPSSGAGILVLESLETAQKRGANIIAEILGTSLNCGGMRFGGTMTLPSAAGVKRCIRQAMMEAEIEPTDIDYINGHLTATMADPLEVKNWSDALELSPDKFPTINSTKSMIGHGLGAAGVMESIAGLLQMKHGFIHPSINCEDVHEKVAPFAGSIPQKLIHKDIDIFAKASFGFGDVNSCLIFKKWS